MELFIQLVINGLLLGGAYTIISVITWGEHQSENG